MRLLLTPDEREALKSRAEADGVSMEDAAKLAIRIYVGEADHDERIAAAAARIAGAHAEALDRLRR